MQENVPEADNASSSDMECNEQELEDVRVCDTCGDAGYEEKLAPCCRCENGTEHIYCMPNNPKEVPRNWVCETCKQKEKESIRISNEEMAKASETVAEEKVKEDASSIEKTSLVRNSSDEGEEKQKEKVKQSIIPQKRKMDALTIPTPRQVKPLHSPPPSIKGKTSALNTLRAPKAPLPPLNTPKPANGKPGSPPRVSNAEGLQLQMPVDGRQIPRPISKEEKASPAVPANTLQKPDTPVNRIALEISKAKEVLQSRSFQERQRANAGNPALQSVADVQANPLLQAKTTAPLNSSKLRDVEKQDTENAKANQTEDVEVKNEKPKMATPGIGANGALPRTCHKCNGVGHLPQFCPNGAVKTLLGQILQSDPNSTQQASEHPPSSEPLSVQLPSPTGTPPVAPAASVQAPEASIQVQAQALLTSTQASQLPVASVEAATCVPASDPAHTAQAPVPQLQLPVTAEPGVPFPTATVQVLQVPVQPPQVACPVQVPGTPVQVPLPPPVFTPIQLAHPSPNALWRGVLKIICSEGKETLLDGVKAYASNKADPKVLEASTSFQSILYLEELPRLRAWPKKFEITPPGDNDIALYLFPINDERLTRQYKELLDRMTSMDLVLKTKVDEVELLIYSSMIFDYELQYFGIEQKPYLWGVFRKPPVAKHMPTVEAQEALNKDVPAVNVPAVVPGIETNKKENAGDETQLSSEQMDVPPGYAPQDLAEKESPPEYGPKGLADKEARAEEKLKQQDTGKPDHIERPRNERRGSYRDHRKESERYHRSCRDKDRSSRRLVRSSSRRSRSRSRSPRRKRYRHSYRHSRSRSRSRSRSPDRRRRDRSRRSRSRSPSWSRSRSYSRSPARRPDKNRSRSHTRSASPRKHSTQHGRSRSRSPPRTSLESHKSPEVNPVYHNFLDLERTSDQECTVAVAEPPRRGGFDLELAPQADDLTLAVPQYRKAGGSWVKVEEIGKEDVNFALSSLCSSSSNTQANHS